MKRKLFNAVARNSLRESPSGIHLIYVVPAHTVCDLCTNFNSSTRWATSETTLQTEERGRHFEVYHITLDTDEYTKTSAVE